MNHTVLIKHDDEYRTSHPSFLVPMATHVEGVHERDGERWRERRDS